MLWFTILTLISPMIAGFGKTCTGGNSEKGGTILGGWAACFMTVVIVFYIINWVRADSNSQTRPHAHANVMSAVLSQQT